jgi:uncharacterized protein YjbI with pentapeptide repeats
MKFWRLITNFLLAIVMFLIPLSNLTLLPSDAEAASSTSVTKSILNAADGEDFSGKSLIKAEFNNTTFKNINFTNADLRGALFNGVFLDGANLHGINFGSGIAYVSRFKDVDLTDAILTDSNMLRSTFDNVNVTGADFTDALLSVQDTKKLCVNASGKNSKTGVDTRESLGC